MSFLTEFKSFATRGNVVDLATAVVIGTAFGKIISSLVDGIVMPLIGLLLGGINISEKSFTFGQATIKWGMFLQSVIDFTIIAFAIFCLLKIINKVQYKKDQDSRKVAEASQEVLLLTEIRDILKEY